MRRLLSIAVTVILAACGSNEPSTTPPPPPGGTTPAVVSVLAGDGQQAEPGKPVAIVPKVVVKDAAGLGVAGVTVAFAVDSGGGTVQASSAVTASDGTASPGTWTLGSVEGRHVLKVTVGNLTPAKIVAIAGVAAITIATQTVGSGGGTISVSTGVLAGTKLVIPAGAFTSSGSWKLEQRSNASWPRRAGVQPVGAVLRVTSADTGIAGRDMMLTLPAVVPAGTKPFVLIRNPGTNSIEVLQTVTVDPGTITVAVRHFDGTAVTAPRQGLAALMGSILLASGVANPYDAEVVVSAIPVADLDKDVDTGFRPGTDDWEFPWLPTSINPPPLVGNVFGRGPLELGTAVTAMAYFAHLKATSGALSKKYLEIPEVPLSNATGYRVASYHAYGMNDAIMVALTTVRNSMRSGIDQVFYDVLKANLVVTGLPQLMIVSGAGGWVPVIAWRVVGGRVDVANPVQPGVTASFQFAAGAFGAFAPVVDVNGATMTAQWIGTTPIGQWRKMSVVANDIKSIAATGEPGGALWPAARLMARGGFADDTTLYILDDTTRFWFECAPCKRALTSTVVPGKVEPFLAYVRDNNNQLSVFTGTGPDGVRVTQTTETDNRVGFVKLESNGSEVSWLDFQWIRVVRWLVEMPAGLMAQPGTPKTITATVKGSALPAGHRFT